MNKFLKRGLLAVGGAVVAGAASAATDTTALTAAITDAGTAAGVVGTAVLVVLVSIRALKYIRSAL
ncbi:hypothetical protein RugamoR57_29080 [Duganella caerulea]|uniref:major capsid protein n=1 Tax=Duganella caerulea TaxID=2885762 RepID=UPI0030E79651